MPRRGTRSLLGYIAVMLPYVTWLTIFILVPLCLVGWFSFSDSNFRFTFENIINACKYSNVFLTSIWLGTVSTVICLAAGYPMAYFISKCSRQYRDISILILMIPTWLSFLLRTYAWMTILENNGFLNMLLRSMGLSGFSMINTQGAVIFGMVYNVLPYMVIQIHSALTKIDNSLIEAAQDLGANAFKTFLKVIFPLSLPGVISGVMMVFVPSVSAFVVSKMLGGGSTLLVGDLIEMQFLGNSYNPHLGSAISLFLIVLIMTCMGIMNQFESGETHNADMVM